MLAKTKSAVRALPSVDALLKDPALIPFIDKSGRALVTQAVRDVLTRCRTNILKNKATAPATKVLVQAVVESLQTLDQPHLKRVINATGIILHTGLGRAVLPKTARDALAGLTGSCNLQIDLETGERNEREHVVRDMLKRITGAEDVAVVNNNASATLLVLRALAQDREVIVSRGEQIEIGGSFRLPDVMRESGAVMREVGTTNKTHLRDYKSAVGPKSALILKVHKSNYRVVGFTKEVELAELVELGKARRIPVAFDLGSGNLVDLEMFGLKDEPTVQAGLKAGADVIFFSGDKLIGGPQAGIIVGRKKFVEKIRAHPLYRALRVDKMTMAALEQALRTFLNPGQLTRTNPTFMMLAKTPQEMRSQAESLRQRLTELKPNWNLSVVEEEAFLGGGALPTRELPGFALRISLKSTKADHLARQFRLASPPVVPYIKNNGVLLNMRTVFEDEIEDIVKAAVQIRD